MPTRMRPMAGQTRAGVSRQQVSQLREALCPAIAVERQALIGREVALHEDDFSVLVQLCERQLGDRLAVVGIGRLPTEGEGDAVRRVDVHELTGEVERVPL